MDTGTIKEPSLRMKRAPLCTGKVGVPMRHTDTGVRVGSCGPGLRNKRHRNSTPFDAYGLYTADQYITIPYMPSVQYVTPGVGYSDV